MPFPSGKGRFPREANGQSGVVCKAVTPTTFDVGIGRQRGCRIRTSLMTNVLRDVRSVGFAEQLTHAFQDILPGIPLELGRKLGLILDRSGRSPADSAINVPQYGLITHLDVDIAVLFLDLRRMALASRQCPPVEQEEDVLFQRHVCEYVIEAARGSEEKLKLDFVGGARFGCSLQDFLDQDTRPDEVECAVCLTWLDGYAPAAMNAEEPTDDDEIGGLCHLPQRLEMIEIGGEGERSPEQVRALQDRVR